MPPDRRRHDDDMRQIEAIAEWQARQTYDPARGIPLAAWIHARRRFARIDEQRRRLGRRGTRPTFLAIENIPPPSTAPAATADPGPWHRRVLHGQVRWVRAAVCAACAEPYWQRREPIPRRYCSLTCAGSARRREATCPVCRLRPATGRRRNCAQCRHRRARAAEVRCRWCGTTFACWPSTAHRRRYCCREHYWRLLRRSAEFPIVAGMTTKQPAKMRRVVLTLEIDTTATVTDLRRLQAVTLEFAGKIVKASKAGSEDGRLVQVHANKVAP